MFLKNKIILVTGAAGFIGSNLVDRLLEEGARVIGIDNFVAGKYANIKHLKNNKHFELVRADIKNLKAIRPHLIKSDIVFNLAASKLVVSLEKPRTDLETNIIGTFNILEILKDKNDIRLIHASTGSVLGSSDKPMFEDWPPKPTTLYGISKLSAERYCMFYAREFGVKVSVIRYFHVFGPRQDYEGASGVVNIFLSRVLTGKPLIVYGTGEQIRCLTYVKDDVDATLLIARKEEAIGQIYNVASPARISVKELAELIIKKSGKKAAKIVYGPPRQGENLSPIPDTRKIEKLGFKARWTFEEGLAETKRWIEQDLKEKRLLR